MHFLVFEGLDASGKSSLIKSLSEHLKHHHISHILTREPGGSQLGDELRELLTRTKGEAPVPRAELLLYQAGRAQHVDLKIRPALKRGDWVLCDRFSASSIAFQSGGRKLPAQEIEWLNNYATGSLLPDLYVLLDLPLEESRKRLQNRHSTTGQEPDRFEKEQDAFHEGVRKSYLGQAQQDPARWLILSATQSTEDMLKTLLKELERRKWLV